MADIQFTIALPEALVERAAAVGFDLDEQVEAIVAIVEREIARKEAALRLAAMAEAMREMPNKPSLEEIEAEVQAVRANRAANSS